MFVGNIVQIVISAFRCSDEDVHFVTFFAYEQAMVFESGVISMELTDYVSIEFFTHIVKTVTAE